MEKKKKKRKKKNLYKKIKKKKLLITHFKKVKKWIKLKTDGFMKLDNCGLVIHIQQKQNINNKKKYPL